MDVLAGHNDNGNDRIMRKEARRYGIAHLHRSYSYPYMRDVSAL